MSNKYTPGQRLKSAQEVMQALLDGQKIVAEYPSSPYFIHLVDGRFKDDTGEDDEPLLSVFPWFIYIPPKRTREVTCYVNVYKQDCETFAYNSEEKARKLADLDALAVAVPCKIIVEY